MTVSLFQSQNGLILTLCIQRHIPCTCRISIPKWSYFNGKLPVAYRAAGLNFNPKMVLF